MIDSTTLFFVMSHSLAALAGWYARGIVSHLKSLKIKGKKFEIDWLMIGILFFSIIWGIVTVRQAFTGVEVPEIGILHGAMAALIGYLGKLKYEENKNKD